MVRPILLEDNDTNIHRLGYRTVNMRLHLWQRLAKIKVANPKFESISDVIEAILEQNKILKNKLINSTHERNNTENKD